MVDNRMISLICKELSEVSEDQKSNRKRQIMNSF